MVASCTNEKLKRDSCSIINSLKAWNFQGGMTHPCEDTIRRWYLDTKIIFTQWGIDMIHDANTTVSYAGVAPDLLRCISHVDEVDEQSKLRFAGLALHGGDLDMREAALSMLDCIGNEHAAEVLKQHKDPVEWLEDYRTQILTDILDVCKEESENKL